jgi:glycosyltransferase involved in cell wall biosynthesis
LVIVVEHANPSWEGRQKLGNAVRKILCIRKSRYVAVSEHIKPPFPFNEYLAVIPNPIDNDSTSNKHEVGNQIKRLVYVGRLAKVHKNPGLLLQISQEVKIPVVYFGDGELRNNLTEQAISMGVSAEFRGWVENPWRELSPYDLLIVPSEHEGDGLVVVEAILRGVPVVMRNVEDLIRFHLPNHHYCTSLGEFVLRINLNLLSLQKFVPPHESRLKLQESRNLNSVVDQWLDFISLSKRNTIYPDSY